jgi:hypothetical protein
MKYIDARLWGVHLAWISAWLSVVWVGYWIATAVAKAAPVVLRNTIGALAPVRCHCYLSGVFVAHFQPPQELKHYIASLIPIERYVAILFWSIAIFATWKPFVEDRSVDQDISQGNGSILFYWFRVRSSCLRFEGLALTS